VFEFICYCKILRLIFEANRSKLLWHPCGCPVVSSVLLNDVYDRTLNSIITNLYLQTTAEWRSCNYSLVHLFRNFTHNGRYLSAKITNAITLQSTDRRVTERRIGLRTKERLVIFIRLNIWTIFQERRTNLLECSWSRESVIWGP